jgi:predicted PurR-regulated permease PerM
LVLLGLLAWGVFSLRDDVRQAVEALPEAARRAREMVASQSGSGAGASIQRAAEELRGTGSTGGAQPKTQSSGGEGQEPAGQPAGGAQQAGGSTSGVTGLIQRGVGSIFALAGHLLVIVFLVFFLLLSGHHVRNRLVEIAGPDGERRRVVATIVDDINAQVQRFLLVRLVTAAVVGALTWAVLAWMGVQNAAVWGILAGVFNSIPYFGPVIVSGGLFVVGLVQGGGMTQALQMSGAALAITSLEGWLLTPPLMGKAERMSVLAVFLGLLLWTWVWGAWGTILAVPMLVVVKSVADHVDSLKPIGRLMAP